MQVILVRHGQAGRKDRWVGPDELRPLSRQGVRQAEWLCELLVPTQPRRIISSPLLRCVETIAPLAQALEIRIEYSNDLTPSSQKEALALIRGTGASGESPVVVCTHGEAMGFVLSELSTQDGVGLDRKPPGPKGCVWFLEMEKGRLSSARYRAPRG